MEVNILTITDKNEFQSGVKRVIISEEEIQREIKKCADWISQEYEGKPLLLVSVLKGAFVFLSDLSKEITIPCEIGFMAAKSYFESIESSGDVQILYDLTQDISQYHVVIVEDIIDTGRTLSAIIELLKKRDPLSLKLVTLLDKPDRRLIKLRADYTLFTIPDYFVIGYGLDFGEYYRNLPYIAEYNTALLD
jgi:hypoxanthine phosphoribosyltransferase